MIVTGDFVWVSIFLRPSKHRVECDLSTTYAVVQILQDDAKSLHAHLDMHIQTVVRVSLSPPSAYVCLALRHGLPTLSLSR